MKRLFLGFVLAVAAALLTPVAASAATYETFVGCDDLSDNPVPSNVCQVGDFLGVYFESDVDTEYVACIEFPTEEVFCSKEEEAEAGALYVNSIRPDLTGDYFVAWFVEDEEVGFWEFRLDPPPPRPSSPPSTTPPSIPTLPAIAPAPSVECLKAQRRVGTLKGQLRNTKGRSQKARVRGKLKTARATVKRVC